MALKKAIYLSGGGARGAYQAGVLKGIQEIISAKTLPVQVLSSVSAGSINAAMLASYADDFALAVDKLNNLWSNLSCDKIFHAGNISLMRSILRNIATMALHYQTHKGSYLLDTAPLKALLEEQLDFRRINRNIAKGLLDFEVATTCYDMSETVSFLNASREVACWKKIRHYACQKDISCEHILASAAFPLFFPSVRIDDMRYGDGGIRLSYPLRAAIKLGADSILVISTRAVPPLPVKSHFKKASAVGGISFANMMGNMANALFLDNLDRDLDLLNDINNSLKLVPKTKIRQSHWRPINVLCIRPSVDIGQLATDKRQVLPSLLKYLMGSFGSKRQSGDFLSFLLFEAAYCRILIDVGYNDALKKKSEIVKFFDPVQ